MRALFVDGYGKHAHAVRQSVTVNNTGINIAAEAGAPGKSRVRRRGQRGVLRAGMNNAVMIGHGDYVTVYANLEAVGVKTGDRVALNQTIGKLPADDAFLHFEIWKDQQNLNPELWLQQIGNTNLKGIVRKLLQQSCEFAFRASARLPYGFAGRQPAEGWEIPEPCPSFSAPTRRFWRSTGAI